MKKSHPQSKDTIAPTSEPKQKMGVVRRLKLFFLRTNHLINKDIWRVSDKTKRPFWRSLLRVLIVSVRGYTSDNIARRASALAYRSILAIVPLFAILIGVAKGFGLQELFADALEELGPMHEAEWSSLYSFVDNTLEYANGGLFMGVGIISLLYMVYVLLFDIEQNLNQIWGIRANRSLKFRVITYLGLLLIMPILLVTASGLTLTMRTLTSTFLGDYLILGHTASFLLKLVPFILIIFAFTGLLLVLPNTKVKFLPAFIGGALAGTAFQLFQLLYMTGMVWISRYSAIYGSLAFFFLLLLWMHLTWIITLFCAKLAYAIQNIDSFLYINEVNNASRRYTDFLTLVVFHAIVYRFVEDENATPHSAESISKEHAIPIRMVQRIIELLLSLELIAEVIDTKSGDRGYFVPQNNPESITVGDLFALLDKKGTEDFEIEENKTYIELWEATLTSRKGYEMAPASLPIVQLRLRLKEEERSQSESE